MLDSSIVMVLAGGKSDDVPNALARSKLLLRMHETEKDVIAIPAVALAECCHSGEKLWSKLKILNFDAAAAVLANRIAPRMLSQRGQQTTKQAVKVDAMILATAVVARARVLYTLDGWFRTIVEQESLNIDVRGLPEHETTGQLPLA